MKLKGKKTYIVAALFIIKAALSYLAGDASLSEAIDMILLGTGLGTMRAGIGGKP